MGEILDELKPQAILLTGIAYDFDLAAYFQALRRRIPVWIRMETQDEAVSRGRIKALVRSGVYRFLYAGVAKAFFIGELNRVHYLRHGLTSQQLIRSPYFTVDRLAGVGDPEKHARREATRRRLGIDPENCVIGFFGKLTKKKVRISSSMLWSVFPATTTGRSSWVPASWRTTSVLAPTTA